MVTILNSPILTDFGDFSFRQTDLAEARKLVDGGFESAIGHQSTADVISTLLQVECPMNRVLYRQGKGDTALVFRLNGRPPEGQILSIEEIEGMGYSWAVLERTA